MISTKGWPTRTGCIKNDVDMRFEGAYKGDS
jgi:hypothetical protein